MLSANRSIDGVSTEVPFVPSPPGTSGGLKGSGLVKVSGGFGPTKGLG
jgi:hypothetical protein